MSRTRPLLLAVGVGTLAVTVAGAGRLLDPPPAGLPPPPAGLVGTTVHGVVDSDPPPVRVGPPAAAGLAAVDAVFVTDGQEVRAGDKLVQFDDRLARAKLDQARGKLAGAEALVMKAKAARTAHADRLAGQRLAVRTAEAALQAAVEGVRRGRDKQERILAADRNVSTGQPLTEAEKDKRRQDNLELFAAETNVTALRNRVEAERLGVKALDADPVEANVTAAEGEAAAARGLVAEAEAAADACLIRARVAGTVEQLDAAPGASYGPANRTPLLLLVPSGGRVVRAEVDPEFAYRIDGKVGAAVTVTDFTNTALTYKGVVRRVGKAFVPKPSAAGGLAGLDPPKALICVIDLPDPAPAGKPPLRVNQPVRVVFPQ